MKKTFLLFNQPFLRIVNPCFILFLLLVAQVVNAKDIELDITTDMGDNLVYKKGDQVQFLLNLSDDAYLFIFYLDASGVLHKLLPVSYDSLLFVKAGFFIPVPDPKNLKFIVSEPFGNEKITIVALSDISHASQLIRMKSNDLADVINKFQVFSELNNIDFGYTSKKIITRKD